VAKKKVGDVSLPERNAWIDQGSDLSIRRQCALAGLARSSWYYRPCGESEENLLYMRLIDEQYVFTSPKFTHKADFYNLDAIIAVGYRVNGRQATRFRICATQTLKEFILKGFVLDDERLKQGKRFGKDYFDWAGKKNLSECFTALAYLRLKKRAE